MRSASIPARTAAAATVLLVSMAWLTTGVAAQAVAVS
jgi:hypothetical protein